MNPLSLLFLGACFVWFLIAKLYTVIYTRQNSADAFKTLAGTGIIVGIIMGVAHGDLKKVIVLAVPMVIGSLLLHLIEKWEELRKQQTLTS